MNTSVETSSSLPNQIQTTQSKPPSESSGRNWIVSGVMKAYLITFNSLKDVVTNIVLQLTETMKKEEDHVVYKRVDQMLRKSPDNPNYYSIARAIEQITLYSNQAEALFKFFTSELKIPVVYGFQPVSQATNYPIEQSTRMGCAFLNNFKIHCVEQPALNTLRSYLSVIFTMLLGERVVGRLFNANIELHDEQMNSDKNITTLYYSSQAHTFGLLGVSLLSGVTESSLLKSRNIIYTKQLKSLHEYIITKPMLSKIKMDKHERVTIFKQTFLFGSIWEFFKKYFYKNEPFKNHGLYTIRYHPYFDLLVKLVSDKHVKFVRMDDFRGSSWNLKYLPLGVLKIKSCKEIEFHTTAIRENVDGLLTFIKLFGSQCVEVIEAYRHYIWDFSKLPHHPNTSPCPNLRVICMDRSELCEMNRVYGIRRLVFEVESLDHCQYQLQSKGIPFILESSSISISHPLLQNIQINLVE
ncbi:hypothetical protein FDP41_011491 [Naegleria fowleri]|uniref:Uncharacterized protein n=1 Tax=Naegleria fowleri TaxID=5763 RepID=A0A6A5C655_NAEFO|nr:uncharacterized protein FDP41_011491 [Naegleria fowleri]KAF0982561.1 hypothetical protein FDP41_011491 [Naegleria fowleri]CAG4716629.1 unnamed protein product [Naegleria fowleri]